MYSVVNVIDDFVKRSWIEKVGGLGKRQLSCNCLESQVAGQAMLLQLPMKRIQWKERKEVHSIAAAITVSDSGEKPSKAFHEREPISFLQYKKLMHLSHKTKMLQKLNYV